MRNTDYSNLFFAGVNDYFMLRAAFGAHRVPSCRLPGFRHTLRIDRLAKQKLARLVAPYVLIFYRSYATEKWPEHRVIAVPALSPTMTQGNIGAWRKAVGDRIVPGDVLVEIETDKATMDFECQEEGFLASQLLPEGTKEVAVGKPLAILVEESGAVPAFKNYRVEDEVKEVPTSTATAKEIKETSQVKEEMIAHTLQASSASAPSSSRALGRIIASPVARYIAKKSNLDLSQVHGTGPSNRILKSDVLEALNAGTTAARQPAVAHGAAFTDIPLSSIRKVIAARLTESKQTIPHYYLTVDVNMDRVLAIRKSVNEAAKGTYKLSVNDFIIKAAAMAMREVPEVNSSWHETFMRQHHKADISVAVATESGLITPIVEDADLKGLVEISSEVKSLAELAKKNRLRPEQFQGGTFTVSNLGMYGISHFTAVINPPQSCILAVGGTQTRLIPEGDGTIRGAQMITVTMSCDHRVVDGAVGARWLQHFKRFMEEPALMLLG